MPLPESVQRVRRGEAFVREKSQTHCAPVGQATQLLCPLLFCHMPISQFSHIIQASLRNLPGLQFGVVGEGVGGIGVGTASPGGAGVGVLQVLACWSGLQFVQAGTNLPFGHNTQ